MVKRGKWLEEKRIFKKVGGWVLVYSVLNTDNHTIYIYRERKQTGRNRNVKTNKENQKKN